MDCLKQVIEAMTQLETDTGVPKNIKLKISGIIKSLQSDGEIMMKTSKALHEFETVIDDINVDSFTRGQLFNIISLLESASQKPRA